MRAIRDNGLRKGYVDSESDESNEFRYVGLEIPVSCLCESVAVPSYISTRIEGVEGRRECSYKGFEPTGLRE